MSEFKITKERILEAATKCSDAARTLKILFPEAFTVEDAVATFTSKAGTKVLATIQLPGSNGPVHTINVRGDGIYKDKALFLPSHTGYEWQVEEDPSNFDKTNRILVLRKVK